MHTERLQEYQYNDTQHNGNQNNDTQQDDIQHLNKYNATLNITALSTKHNDL